MYNTQVYLAVMILASNIHSVVSQKFRNVPWMYVSVVMMLVSNIH